MNDERLGMAAGAVLRDHDRPAADARRSLGVVMAQVRVTPQVSRSRWWPSLRRAAVPTGQLETAGPPDHPTTITNGRTSRPSPTQTGGPRTMSSAVKLMVAGVGVALVSVFLASGVLTPSTPGVPGAASPGSPGTPGVAWTTDRVSLVADEFRLEVNDLVFGDDVWPTRVDSDPGNPGYWTLEIEWTEQDIDQRLNLYFAADDTDWWVREIRTYDGHEQGEWVYAYGPFFTTPLGEAFEGDVTVDLLGEGRPDDPNDLIPAVLSFEGLRLAVHPGTGEPPLSDATAEVVPELSPFPAEADGTTGAASPGQADELCTAAEYPTEEGAALCRALVTAFGDPAKGDPCLSIEQAHAVATDVLSELGMTGWSVENSSYVRDDGCTSASVSPEDHRIVLVTGMRPEVMAAVEAFRVLSLDQCLDASEAVEMLTATLDESGSTDFVVKLDPTMLGGPIGSEEEITAHADAGCAFYVGSGGESDGTPIYYIHGE